MSRALVAFLISIGVIALCGSARLQAQETSTALKDPISPADCLKDKKKAVDCLRLGLLYAEGKEVPTDLTKGIAFLDAACRRGVRAACHVRGWFLIKRNASPDDVAEGLRILEEECKRRVPGACGSLGHAYAQGGAGPRDVLKALRHLEGACESGEGFACHVMGTLLRSGDGIARDEKRASTLTLKACHLGELPACEGGCEAGDGGTCLEWAQRLIRGRAESASIDRALERACNAASAPGCSQLAARLKDDAQALAMHERACALESAADCAVAARTYYFGHGVTADLTSAARLYEEACARGDGASCATLGGFYARGDLGSEEAEKGQAYFGKACSKDIACLAIVASGRIPSVWGGSLEALRPRATDKDGDGYDEPPRLLYQTKPVYPRRAYNRKVIGVVHLSITIGTDGRVVDARVIRGNPELDAAAIECVKQWRFVPARRRGFAVVSVADAPITFNLL